MCTGVFLMSRIPLRGGHGQLGLAWENVSVFLQTKRYCCRLSFKGEVMKTLKDMPFFTNKIVNLLDRCLAKNQYL